MTNLSVKIDTRIHASHVQDNRMWMVKRLDWLNRTVAAAAYTRMLPKIIPLMSKIVIGRGQDKQGIIKDLKIVAVMGIILKLSFMFNNILAIEGLLSAEDLFTLKEVLKESDYLYEELSKYDRKLYYHELPAGLKLKINKYMGDNYRRSQNLDSAIKTKKRELVKELQNYRRIEKEESASIVEDDDLVPAAAFFR